MRGDRRWIPAFMMEIPMCPVRQGLAPRDTDARLRPVRHRRRDATAPRLEVSVQTIARRRLLPHRSHRPDRKAATGSFQTSLGSPTRVAGSVRKELNLGVQKCGCSMPFRCLPFPVLRRPVFRVFITAGLHELQILMIGHRKHVDRKARHLDLVCAEFVVPTEGVR